MQNKFLVLGFITLAVELGCYVGYLYAWGYRHIWPMVIFVFLVNGFTWPLATYLYHSHSFNLFCLEMAVVLAESVICVVYFKISWKLGVGASVLANLCSYMAGVLVYS